MSTWTYEQLAALKAAAAKGVTRLRIGDEEVQYRSLDEMLRMIAMIERTLAGDLPARHYPVFRRG